MVREFFLTRDKVKVVPAADHPLTGEYQLVYRCPEHENFDIKRAVASDGSDWRIAETLPPDEDVEICYPELQVAGQQG